MYTIAFPIHVYQASPTRYFIPVGLARDIIAQLSFERDLTIICPNAATLESVASPFCIETRNFPSLNIILLPYTGRRGFLLHLVKIFRALRNAAKSSSVWHTGCSTKLFELTSLSFYVGLLFAPKLRILCLDSDPASMLENSSIWTRWKAPIIRDRYRRWARNVDAVIFVGVGAENTYSRFARRFVTTGAVWLNEGDLADKAETARKFDEVDQGVRIALPTRLTAWKGVDDVLNALNEVKDSLPVSWTLDIIGEGPERDRLVLQAASISRNIRFVKSLDYGESFFSKLRSYHIVLVPTRGLEEARIAYDAAASGCVLISLQHTDLEKCAVRRGTSLGVQGGRRSKFGEGHVNRL